MITTQRLAEIDAEILEIVEKWPYKYVSSHFSDCTDWGVAMDRLSVLASEGKIEFVRQPGSISCGWHIKRPRWWIIAWHWIKRG